jgi:hypothetical protein
LKTKLTILATIATLAILSSLSIFASADTGSQWVTYGQTTNGGGNLVFAPIAHGTFFVFPSADPEISNPGWVNYLLDTYSTSLTQSDILSATFIVSADSGTVYIGDTFGTQNLAEPSYVRLFFQSNLPATNSPSCVGSGSNVDNYWWATDSTTGWYTFSSGSVPTTTISAMLTPSNWSNICGQNGGSDPNFALAIQNIKYVGLSFGSGFFFASGVGVTGGTATFALQTYSV